MCNQCAICHKSEDETQLMPIFIKEKSDGYIQYVCVSCQRLIKAIAEDVAKSIYRKMDAMR